MFCMTAEKTDGKIGYGGTIDFMVCSHDHDDHFKGLGMALGRYDIENFYAPGEQEKIDIDDMYSEENRLTNEGCPRYYPTSGKYLSGPNTNVGPNWDNDVEVKVLWSDDSASGNNRSLTLKISLGQSSLHLGGDLENSQELEIADGDSVPYAGVTSDLANIDVYHVDHHGSTSSSNETFLNVMSPKYAIQQQGGTAFYNESFERVKNARPGGTIIYRNNLDGKVIFKCDDKGNWDIVREYTFGNPPGYIEKNASGSSDSYQKSPPSLPTGLTANLAANSVFLDWDNTTQDTQGNAINCD